MTPITEPSICIPRTLNNISWREVKDTFEHLCGKGTVERVDIVRKKDDSSPFCRIFVHMRYWAIDKPDVAAIRQRLVDGESVKVVYDNPWFWKCSASHAPKPERTKMREAPFVEFTGEISLKPPSQPRSPATLKIEKNVDDVDEVADIENGLTKV